MRADASETIGTGHIMRCVALAQTWQASGGEVLFVVRSLPSALEQRLEREKMETHRLNPSCDDAAETIAIALGWSADWVVLDGYHFKEGFQRAIKAAGLRLLVVDDFGGVGQIEADLVLNQNVYATKAYTHRRPGTALLLGTRYALLRREFLDARFARAAEPAENLDVLVTLGGTDPENVTGTVLDIVGRIDGIGSLVLVGPGNPRAPQLAEQARHLHGTVQVRVNPPDIPELMASSDFAISAAGTTCWELAFTGLPMLLIVLAENQRRTAERLDELGIAINLGALLAHFMWTCHGTHALWTHATRTHHRPHPLFNLFSHLTMEGWASAVLKEIRPTMRLGVVATAFGFSVLLLSGFPGLSQGLFAMVADSPRETYPFSNCPPFSGTYPPCPSAPPATPGSWTATGLLRNSTMKDPNVEQTRTTGTICPWVSMTRAPLIVGLYF